MSAINLISAVWTTLRSPQWCEQWADEEERAALMAMAVAQALGGARAPTPEAVRRELDRGRRNARIRRQHAQGISPAVLATRHRLSLRQIWRIVGGATLSVQVTPGDAPESRPGPDNGDDA